jgi:hypothetical protein
MLICHLLYGIKLYNTPPLPGLLHGSENWTMKARDPSRITAAEMKYMRRTRGYIRADHKTNAKIARELTMLSGCPVTMAWRILRLQMEETASRYRG